MLAQHVNHATTADTLFRYSNSVEYFLRMQSRHYFFYIKRMFLIWTKTLLKTIAYWLTVMFCDDASRLCSSNIDSKWVITKRWLL